MRIPRKKRKKNQAIGLLKKYKRFAGRRVFTVKGMSEKEKRVFILNLEAAEKNGVPLCKVFEKTARKTGLSSGSVRNYYYRVIAKKNAQIFSVKKRVLWTQKEENELLRKVLDERLKCGSTRAAVMNVAGGDKVLAMRYQNKFASMVKRQKAIVMREVLQQKQRLGRSYNPFISNRQSGKNAKLRKEIDALIKKIQNKCAKENEQLRRKIEEYEGGRAADYFAARKESALTSFNKAR